MLYYCVQCIVAFEKPIGMGCINFKKALYIHISYAGFVGCELQNAIPENCIHVLTLVMEWKVQMMIICEGANYWRKKGV